MTTESIYLAHARHYVHGEERDICVLSHLWQVGWREGWPVLLGYLREAVPRQEWKAADQWALNMALLDHVLEIYDAWWSAGAPIDRWDMDDFLPDMAGADLRYADMSEADIRCGCLEDVDLRGARLGAADLQYSNLQGADLRGAELHFADLGNANLQGADIRAADLRDARLVRATLWHARADQHTQWPDGFDPHEHGVEVDP